MTFVRLYGRTQGHGSHAVVTRGFREVLEAEKMLAGTVSLDEDEAAFDDEGVPGAMAPVGVFTGALGMASRMVENARHQKRYAMVAVNSNFVPAGLRKLLPSVCTDLLAPSEWNADRLREVFDLPVHVVKHGVHSAFQPDIEAHQVLREEYRAESLFVVAHFSTSSGDRKGTRALLEAWDMLLRQGKLPDRARLGVILDLQAQSRITEWLADRFGGSVPQNVDIVPRMNFPAEQMVRVLNRVHVVCQPSRGEGFGMVGLEARACAIPVVATRCTGHGAGHLDGPGVVHVVTGPPGAIDDGPDAVAPTVDADAVAASLQVAFENWEQLEKEALVGSVDVRRKWTWARQLDPFVKLLRKENSTDE